MKFLPLIALAAVGVLANTAPLAAQATGDDALRQLCAMDTSSAVCEAGKAGQQKRDGLDLGAEIAKGEAWRGTPATRGEMMTCAASWKVLKDAVVAGDKRWPATLTRAAAEAQIRRWDGFIKRAYKGLEDNIPRDREKEETLARANLGTARVADLAQWAGFCKRDPTFE